MLFCPQGHLYKIISFFDGRVNNNSSGYSFYFYDHQLAGGNPNWADFYGAEGGMTQTNTRMGYQYNGNWNDIFDISKTPLGSLNVNMHYLCPTKNIINILQKNKILSINEINDLKFFLTEPKKWRQKYE